MFDVFAWIRRKAAEAVVNGVGDGLRAVTPDGESVTNIGELRALLATACDPKALPAAKPDAGDAAKKRAK